MGKRYRAVRLDHEGRTGQTWATEDRHCDSRLLSLEWQLGSYTRRSWRRINCYLGSRDEVYLCEDALSLYFEGDLVQ